MVGKPKELDKITFEGLCQIQCTVNEIEAVMHTDQRTVDKWCQRTYEKSFKEVLNSYRDVGKASLRRYQFNLAKANTSMAIWLGKQWLGQRDLPQEIEAFNGNLAKLLDMLKNIKSKEDFSQPKEIDGTSP